VGPYAQGLMFLAGVVILIVVVLRIPRVRARQRKEEQQTQPAAETPNVRLRRTMEELAVQLHEMSREVNAQLDTKMCAIDSLLRRSEEVAARLEALLRQASSAGVVSTPTDRYDDIYRMADDGKTPKEIARLKDLQPGEVELILNLRRRS